ASMVRLPHYTSTMSPVPVFGQSLTDWLSINLPLSVHPSCSVCGHSILPQPVLLIGWSVATHVGRARSRIAPRDGSAEIGIAPNLFWRAGMVRQDPTMLRSKTEGQGGVERLQSLHLAVEPLVSAGPEAVRPAQAGAHVTDS